VLQHDINTQGHTQWYYFKVTSRFAEDTLPKQRTIKFDILNLQKKESLYSSGMRVLVLDCNAEEGNDELPSWQRGGNETTYGMNNFLSSCGNLYSLSFTYEFPIGVNTFYFAHSAPYTYSMLCEFLNAKARKRFHLCQSLAGNRVEYLHIKSNPHSEHQKKVIFITSRVHPGETNASWMLHGLLRVLLDPQGEEEAKLVADLKDHFDFYIVPMLNVDGVINGNYRCSLAAVDLNRRFG
jgi:cytosolic carboxypeptidase protein 2/3